MPIITLADCPPRAWKNGLGRTRELAIHPPGAGMDDFLWRVSIAEVDKAAPFSAFPGVDRVIALLDGDGFTMHLADGRTHALTTPCAPFAFAGELEVAITLDGRPGRDFNLMCRRGHARGTVEARHGPGLHAATPDTVLVFCARSRIDTGEGAVHAGQAWLPTDDAFTLTEDALALVVRVQPAC